MPVAVLLMEFTQPAPSMPSPSPNIRQVSCRGLTDSETAAFTKKHAVQMRQAFNNTHNKGTPLEDMMKDVPTMLSTLESWGYKVVTSTSNSIFKMRDMPDPIVRDCYVWTLVKEAQVASPSSVESNNSNNAAVSDSCQSNPQEEQQASSEQ